MKKASRLVVLLFTAVVCLSVLEAAFCLAVHAKHICSGEACIVCAVTEQCAHRLQGIGSVPANGGTAEFCSCLAACLYIPESREAPRKTPVALKVKLLD